MSELLDNPPSPIQEVEDDTPAPYFCKFTFAQFFTIMILAVFTLGFMFYLGARYGNDYLRLGETASMSTTSASIETIPGASTTDGEKTDEMLKVAREALQQQQTEKLQEQVASVLQNPAAYQQQLAQQPAQQSVGMPPTVALPTGAIPPGAVAPSAVSSAALPPGAVGPGTIPPGAVTPQMAAAMATQDQPLAQVPSVAAQPSAQTLAQAPTQVPGALVPTTVAQTANDRVNEYEPQDIPLKPTADDEPAAAPTAAKSAAGTTFSVQVGTSQDVAEANGWVQGWRDRGYSAFLMVADIPGKGRWYCVRLGSFPTRDSAETFAERLNTKEQVSAIAVQNE